MVNQQPTNISIHPPISFHGERSHRALLGHAISNLIMASPSTWRWFLKSFPQASVGFWVGLLTLNTLKDRSTNCTVDKQ